MAIVDSGTMAIVSEHGVGKSVFPDLCANKKKVFFADLAGVVDSSLTFPR